MRGQLIKRLRATLAGWDPPAKVALLFGSVARGDATAGSDLDLLVVREGGRDPDSDPWQTQLMKLEQSATAWTGNDTRILEYSEEELLDLDDESVLENALREGIELFGSRRALRRLMRAGSKP